MLILLRKWCSLLDQEQLERNSKSQTTTHHIIILNVKFKMADNSDSLVSDNLNIQKQNVTVVQTELNEGNKTEEVFGPVLVEDIDDECIPKSYENLRAVMDSRNVYLDRNDIIVLLLYISMLEMGFVTRGLERCCDETDANACDFNYKRLLALTRQFPHDWKPSDQRYEFAFTLLPFPLYPCNLYVVRMADDLLVNSNVVNIENCTNCMLIDPSLYVVTSSVNLRRVRFQNVRSLTNRFKTAIGYPTKIAVLTENNLRVPHIQTLPEDVLMQIALKLDTLTTLGRFQQVCRLFKDVSEEWKVWKRLIDVGCKIGISSTSRAYRRWKKANKKLTKLKRTVAESNKRREDISND